MYRVKAFRFALCQVQSFHRTQLEAPVENALNDVPGVPRTHRIGFNDCECKIPHLFFSISLIILSRMNFCRGYSRINADLKLRNSKLLALSSQ
jgi:hypothetical protein